MRGTLSIYYLAILQAITQYYAAFYLQQLELSRAPGYIWADTPIYYREKAEVQGGEGPGSQ